MTGPAGDAPREDDRPDLSIIDGLLWRENWRVANGGASFVVPFPRTRPATIVFHGDADFSYGHYGIHLGQRDRLTFLGQSDRPITATFLDCRRGSPTRGASLSVAFAASSRWELAIPPGVAHTFDGLSGVATINAYDLLLPDPDQWVVGDAAWDSRADVVNLPLGAVPTEEDWVSPNGNPASDVYYRLVADRQARSIGSSAYAYPYTYRHVTDGGETYDLRVAERVTTAAPVAWQPIGDIEGLGWAANPLLPSGPHSGFVPLTSGRPFYVVDHGEEAEYTHDAYGIHVGQEDRLIFLGASHLRASVEFVDCRAGSPSLHRTCTIGFTPDATRTLVIPPGVAHRFVHLEGIYTLNQGVLFLPPQDDYAPGHDVIDWPVDHRPFPILATNTDAADPAYYVQLAASQRALRAQGGPASTPTILLAEQADGTKVRVAITA